MKKFLALAGFGFSTIFGLNAHPQGSNINSVEEEAISWPLDSMFLNFHYPVNPMTKLDTAAMNKYHFPPDAVPSYSAEFYKEKIMDMGSAIPFEYNSDVQAYIDLYVLRRREQVSRMLGLQYVYFPMIEEVLDREGLPMELKYLPIIESALNPHAVSRAGATGLWQFMLGTAKMFNVSVTSFVDERRDPYKSTIAAVKFLKSLYNTYHDWLMCIAAYNCGPGNVNRAIVRSGGKKTFWEIKPFLPRETQGYVPVFIAANYVFNYHTEHNLYPIPIEFNYGSDTIMIARQQVALQQIADVTETDFYTLKDLNPELKTNTIPYDPNGYVLRVPHKTALIFTSYRDSIFKLIAATPLDSIKSNYDETKISPVYNRAYATASSPNLSYSSSPTTTTQPTAGVSTSNGILVYYTVRTGDIVGKIAEKYYVSAPQIASWNGLYNYRIWTGQKLKIYVPEKYAAAAGVKTVDSPSSNGTQGGQVVSTPSGNQSGPNNSQAIMEAADKKYYKVQLGDTLWDIAQKYNGLTVERLKELNNLNNSPLIVGQVLVVQ